MKKKLIESYATIMLVLFICNNFILSNLVVEGLLYEIFMILVIILNLFILVKFRKDIKYKNIVIIIYFFIWLFSKDALQCYFDFSNIFILCITGFKESIFIKVLTILIGTFVALFYLPLCFIFAVSFGNEFDGKDGMSDVYEDTHYYCKNHYEIYAYSSGAMDHYHYSIGKYYKIFNIDGIIYIAYQERNEKSREDYQEYLDNHDCYLVGEIDESR